MMIEIPFSPTLYLKRTFIFPKPLYTLQKATNTLQKSHRLLESAVIPISNHIPQRLGFYLISPYLANIILHENNIKIENA